MARLKLIFLQDNHLSGAIPAEFEDLANLTHLYLEGNSFTGCIHAELQETSNHDLENLSLATCQ